ncbi:MAG: (Fe-S)-binding protein [Peptococcaceae bacterium]|nr:(Fe-S)-binding protein [Peptococcaceae bacterium]
MTTKKEIPPVLEIIRSNIMEYNNPLALNCRQNSSWVRDLELPAQGEILFYTGGEYQLLPYLAPLLKTLTFIDPASKAFSLLMEGRKLVKIIGITPEKVLAGVLAQDKERYNSINYKAAYILKKLGFDLCYDADVEMYSGALLYELGFWQDFKLYAARVVEVIRKTQAKTVVCLSPHAAEMFKVVYPQFNVFPEFNVKTFIELVWEKRDNLPQISDKSTVVIHDSCRLARELGITKEIRDIMESVGVSYVEPVRNKEWTTCCGGPGKMLFPEIARIIAERRVNELAETGASKALLACPYCLSSLQAGSKQERNIIIEDLVEFLYRGFIANV